MDATVSSAPPPAEHSVKTELHPPSLSNGLTMVPGTTRFTVTPSTAPPSMGERQLEVKDALSYLDEVKKRFDDRPDVYNKFLDIMKDFKSQILTTPDVIERVSALFRGHPQLISGFNTFLPPGYRIECSTGENQRITVTTPSGTLTQNAAGNLTHNGRMPGPPQGPSVTVPMRASEPPRAPPRKLSGDAGLAEPASVPPPAEIPKRELPPPSTPPTFPSRPSTRPATPIPVTLPLPPPPRSRAATPQSQLPSTAAPVTGGPSSIAPQAPVQFISPSVPSRSPTPQSLPNVGPVPSAASAPNGGLGPAVHPSHISLPPLSQTIAAVSMHDGPLVLTPAVALNSNQTTASAASVLGGMHLVSSNPELGTQQQQIIHQQQQPQQPPPSLQHPVHPPAVFHPSLPQAAHPPPPLPMGGPVQVGTPTGGPLPGPGMQPQPSPQPEFYHAIQYINRIKTRFSDEPETYKQFLEILQTYQKEQRPLHDSPPEQVYAQVTQLFRNAPELIDEFKMFLPDTSGTVMAPGLMTPTSFGGPPPGGTLGVMGVVGQQVGPLGAVPGQTPPSGSSEWTMDVSTMGAKSDKSLSGHRRKTAPGETKGEGPPAKKRRKAIDKESTRAEKEREKEKERDRDRENIPVGVGSAKISSRPRQTSSRIPEPSSPTFAPFGRPLSPVNGQHIPPHPIMHGHTHPSLTPHPHQASLQPLPHPRPPTPIIPIIAAPELFFDRVNRALDDRDAWEEFLKLLNLYSSDIIDGNLLVRAAAPFLGGVGSELEQQFREILGLERHKKDKEKQMMMVSSSNGWLAGSKSRFGPSYRRLPESETTLACSGRDELSRSVLNDEWVSHPVWASEEAGFVAHKKNSYEEVLHRTEDERHEFHVSLESMANTISLLEPIAFKLEQMTNEERVAFRLGPDLGSRSKSIHEKIIKRVYGGSYNAQEVLQCLQESPAVAVPVVLNRLKAVDAEWRRIKREWEKHWREVDLRNFYKSLDHQGLSFKVNDKKAITGKAFLTEIERVKKTQDKERDGIVGEGDNEHIIPGFVPITRVLPRYQLEYDIEDVSVLQDAIKLSICFLERGDQRQGQSNVLQYNTVERRRIEAFLRHYVMYQFALDPEFDAAFGPPIDQAEWEDLGLYVVVDGDAEESAPDDEDTARKGGKKSGKKSSAASSSGTAFSAGDLKKKLSKAKRGGQGRKTNDIFKAYSESNTSNHRSPNSSRLASPVPEGSPPGTPKDGSKKPAKRKGKPRGASLDDVWLRQASLYSGQQPTDRETMDIVEETRSTKPKLKTHGSFFCNTNFYTLLRSLQLLYSRLIMCKNMAAKLAKEGSKGFRPNPVAYSLGLVDTAGPVEYLAAVTAKEPTTNPAEHFYVYLLDLIEKVFDGELEQSVFEENMRFMFGTKAFIVFTLDKVCGAICKQVQAVVQDSRCHELMNMYEQQFVHNAQMSVQDIIRYRRQAELLVGSDDLFRIDWSPEAKKLRIQLLDTDDLSLDPPSSLEDTPVAMNGASGHDAVDSRMTQRCKQYIDSYVLRYPTEGRRIGVIRKPFLKRNLLDEDSDEVNESIWMAGPNKGLQVVVSPRTYRLFFGCEEALWRLRIRVRRNHDVEATTGRHFGRGRRRHRRSSPEEGGEDSQENDVSEWDRLKERAEARLRERRKWVNQFDQGVALLR